MKAAETSRRLNTDTAAARVSEIRAVREETPRLELKLTPAHCTEPPLGVKPAGLTPNHSSHLCDGVTDSTVEKELTLLAAKLISVNAN